MIAPPTKSEAYLLLYDDVQQEVKVCQQYYFSYVHLLILFLFFSTLQDANYTEVPTMITIFQVDMENIQAVILEMIQAVILEMISLSR